MNCIGEILKVDLDNVELNIIIQAMMAVNVKGSDAVAFAKLITKLQNAFENAHKSAEKAELNG